MKRLNITLPEEIYHLLVTNVGKGKISSFLANLAKEKLQTKNDYLAQCYKAASKDKDRTELLNEWNKIDIEGWE